MFSPFASLLGNWQGEGSGFGGQTSKITSSFDLVMGDMYIEVKNDSKFAPTDKNPKGENHSDRGFISFDKQKKAFFYRQFNIEGYVNEYILKEILGEGKKLVFETIAIENFIPGGKARFTIQMIDQDHIETVFDVSTPGKEFMCLGTNKLTRMK